MSNHDYMNSRSRRVILFGFVLIGLILLAISGLTIFHLNDSARELQHVARNTAQQKSLLENMHNASRDRIISLYQMSVTQDAFLRDELWMTFNEKGTEYLASRNRLNRLELDNEMRQILEEQDSKLHPLGVIQLDVAEDLLAGNHQKAQQRLINEAAPLQRGILEYFHELREVLERKENLALANAYLHSKQSRSQIIVFAITFLLLTASIGVFVLRHVRNTEVSILREKEHAQVTLHSIVDGVIMFDREGFITELNDAALTMLQEDRDSIIGKALNSVIHMEMPTDEDQAEPVDLDISVTRDGITIISDTGVNLIRRDDSRLVVEYSLSPVIIGQDTVSLVLVLHDITTMHALATRLDHEASHDALTGIYNRRKFEELLEQSLNDAQRYKHAHSWLCYIDLDHFKNVNDTCGHLAGDKFLVQVAERIKGATREFDHVSRMGGDEFAVILRHAEESDAIAAAERIRNSIGDMEFICGSHRFEVTGSLGLVNIDGSISDMHAVLQFADKACYNSKHAGRNQLHVYRHQT
jgi:diguanylate cyclase (GGDEF)-like protein/PAS domain S-box-containing protein